MNDQDRYSLILDGNRPEEIILLQGRGCFWKNCTFCDYYEDSDIDQRSRIINKRILDKVTGQTGRLTAINSGSFFELPKEDQKRIINICKDKKIKDLSIETHYKYAEQTQELKNNLKELDIEVHPRIGIETFDHDFRENVLVKGIGNIDPKEIAKIYDECCLLFGIKGQTLEQLERDIEIALDNFKDVYLNIYEQRTELEEDPILKQQFIEEFYPKIKNIPNLHILINNTDLGVGD